MQQSIAGHRGDTSTAFLAPEHRETLACTRRTEHLAIVAVPRALEPLIGIVLTLQHQKLLHLWVAALNLVAPRPAMVSQVIAAAVRDAEVDEITERCGRFLDLAWRVLDVQVEDDAGIPIARPGQKRLVVFFDQANRAVDDVGSPRPEYVARRFCVCE